MIYVKLKNDIESRASPVADVYMITTRDPLSGPRSLESCRDLDRRKRCAWAPRQGLESRSDGVAAALARLALSFQLSYRLSLLLQGLARHSMAGPNLEVFKFSVYVFFPVLMLVYYGDPDWYSRNVLPVCILSS